MKEMEAYFIIDPLFMFWKLYYSQFPFMLLKLEDSLF
jgi:hypothetical protein